MKFGKFFCSVSVLLLLLYCSSFSAFAAEIVPFSTRNQSPLVVIFGLPALGDPAIAAPGVKQLALGMDLASNYVDDSAGSEHILLDGESLRLNLSGRWGLGNGLEIGAEIPFIVLGGGFLDNFIIDYHNTFGFPQGGRDTAPRNRLLYLYSKNNGEKLRLENSGSGLGDISVQGGWQLYKGEGDYPGAVSVRAQLKLPTGDADSLRGSGSTDLSLWLAAGKGFPLPRGHLAIYGGAGILAMTEGKVLPDQQRSFVGFGNFGIGWDPFSSLVLKVQADAHTSFYQDSSLKEVNSASVQLTVGGTIALGEKTSLDIGVSEDLVVATAPDVVFHLALKRTF